jgi:tetratricopeptide (TPR) repeat protein
MKLPPDGYSSSGDSSSSSSSGDSSSSSRPADDDADVAPTTAAPNAPVKAAKLKDLGSRGDFSAAHQKLEQTRVADDLKIAKFYWNDGNTQGAYLRYKDAVDHAPDDPEARFGLAEAASKLKKTDEAVLNYREYLKADPDGDHDKDARRALARLGAAVQ